MKALFIDDEIDCELIVEILTAKHPADKFVLADSLAKAVAATQSERFDVLVVDIMMRADETAVPGSSKEAGLIAGLRLLDHIRSPESSSKNKETPVVLLTGLLPKEHRRVKEAEEGCGQYFVSKPIPVDALYRVMQNAVKGGRR